MDPLWRDLHKIKAPTLLLWGRDDRTITLDGAQIMLKQIRDVQLHVFGNCGHWVQLERQAEFERLVTDFLGAMAHDRLAGGLRRPDHRRRLRHRPRGRRTIRRRGRLRRPSSAATPDRLDAVVEAVDATRSACTPSPATSAIRRRPAPRGRRDRRTVRQAGHAGRQRRHLGLPAAAHQADRRGALPQPSTSSSRSTSRATCSPPRPPGASWSRPGAASS